MKKISRILFLFMAAPFLTVSASNAQVRAGVYVNVRPPRPHDVVVVRPARPSREHVWVNEEWTPGNGTYVYHQGYWAVPPRSGAHWSPGHWKHEWHRGYVWIPGHWVY